MTNDLLDLTLLLEVGEGLAGKRTVDLETVDQSGDGDQAVRLDVLVELLRGGLVEDDGVVGLVLDCITNTSASCSASLPLDKKKKKNRPLSLMQIRDFFFLF